MLIMPIENADEDALFLDPKDVFKSAILGSVSEVSPEYDHWDRKEKKNLVLYCTAKVIECLVAENDWSRDDAVEWLEYNILGAWLGEGTPTFINSEEYVLDIDDPTTGGYVDRAIFGKEEDYEEEIDLHITYGGS